MIPLDLWVPFVRYALDKRKNHLSNLSVDLCEQSFAPSFPNRSLQVCFPLGGWVNRLRGEPKGVFSPWGITSASVNGCFYHFISG